MQGVIFNALEEFVLEITDMQTWNDVIDNSQVPNDGAYTYGQSYDDEEIVALAVALCEKLNLPLNDGLKAFGEFLFGYLLNKGPIEVKDYKTTQELLIELEDVIHQDVKRIHPDAYTPFFVYTAKTDNEGTLTYSSKRKMCMVAEGLVAGAAKHFGQTAELNHTNCMHDGADKCSWDLKFTA